METEHTYTLTIEGITPLLQCAANDMLAAQLQINSRVRSDKAEKKTPREVADPLSYDRNGLCWHPTGGLIASIVDAGARFKDPKNPRAKMKSQLPGAVFPTEEFSPILNPATREQYKAGSWEVDVRTGVNNNRGSSTRIVVCRPRFDEWMVTTQIEVDPEIVDADELHTIISAAGKRIGLGAFRPQKRGLFGRFRVVCFDRADMHAQAAE